MLYFVPDALGSLSNRDVVIANLLDLPRAVVVRDDELLDLIGRRALSNLGIGYVDLGLLAAIRLTPSAALWTRDRRLQRAALAFPVPLYSPNSAPRAE